GRWFGHKRRSSAASGFTAARRGAYASADGTRHRPRNLLSNVRRRKARNSRSMDRGSSTPSVRAAAAARILSRSKHDVRRTIGARDGGPHTTSRLLKNARLPRPQDLYASRGRRGDAWGSGAAADDVSKAFPPRRPQ